MFPQGVSDIYKGGNVYLIPDSSYAVGVDWDDLFSGYNDNPSNPDIWRDKKIAVSETGEVFMSHKNHHQIWVFDSAGRLKLKFGEQGGKPNQFPRLPSVETVIGSRYCVTVDVNGRIKLFDHNGRYYRSVNLDFIVKSIHALDDNMLIVSGWVIWKSSFRYLVATVNISTGEQKIVYSTFIPRREMEIKHLVADGDTMMITVSQSKGGKIYLPAPAFFQTPVISFAKDGNFIVAKPATGEAEYYSMEGKLLNKFIFGIEPVVITMKDIEERYQRLIESGKSATERISKMSAWSEAKKEAYLNLMEEEAEEQKEQYSKLENFYPTLPLFSSIIFDSEGNILVFEYTRSDEGADNRFSVFTFDGDGKRIARANLVSGDYSLKITPKTIVFHKGYLYAICEKKGEPGVPLRLMRFSLSSAPAN